MPSSQRRRFRYIDIVEVLRLCPISVGIFEEFFYDENGVLVEAVDLGPRQRGAELFD